MHRSQLDDVDFEFLSEAARAAKRQGVPHFIHLDQPVGRWNYIRIANAIAARIPHGKLLDWGCGFGQMTYLLRRRGFDVTAFDVASQQTELPDIAMCRQLNLVRSDRPTELPFPDGGFDVVLSCGVLEHVDEFSVPGNEVKSLREIRRVLRPGGRFVVYQLPQRYSWQEAVARVLKVGYWHKRLYTAAEIRELLAKNGYEVEWLRRSNLLPKNLTGLPEPLRRLYSTFGRSVLTLDDLLCRIPGLNRLAGVLELSAGRFP